MAVLCVLYSCSLRAPSFGTSCSRLIGSPTAAAHPCRCPVRPALLACCACDAGGQWQIAEAAVAYGGVAPLTIMAHKVGLVFRMILTSVSATLGLRRRGAADKTAHKVGAFGVRLAGLQMHAAKYVCATAPASGSRPQKLPAQSMMFHAPRRPWRRWRGGASTQQRWRRRSRRCSRMCRSQPTRQVWARRVGWGVPARMLACSSPPAQALLCFSFTPYASNQPHIQAAWSSFGAPWPPRFCSRACCGQL